MKIGIDARLINQTGVGRYIRNLVKYLQLLDMENQYVVYLPPSIFDTFILPNTRWQKRLATPRWHTMREQIEMPLLYGKDHLDLLHVPYFSIPILYPGQFVMTIHDVIPFTFATGKATLLPYPLYVIKRFFYLLILKIGLFRAQLVLVPSVTTKQEIMKHFLISEKKIRVTYEGVDDNITQSVSQIPQKNPIGKKFFLYVGNAYPHKNVDFLIEAFFDFVGMQKKNEQYRLVLVGKEDYFYRRLKKSIVGKPFENYIRFMGSVDDDALKILYTNAEALIFPSLMEGFGLPALEALSLGTPVICSDIPIFHEILRDFPIYIHRNTKEQLTKSLSLVVDGKRKKQLKTNKKDIDAFLKNYSWKQLGIDTLSFYNSLKTSPSNI